MIQGIIFGVNLPLCREVSRMEHLMPPKKTLRLVVAIAALAAAFCNPASAHHGTGSSYDTGKTLKLSGVVSKFAWSNPHSQLYFDITAKDGSVVHWGGEMSSPGVLAKIGWTRNSLKPGDKVILTLHPSLAGTPVGELVNVTLPDGRTLCGDGCF